MTNTPTASDPTLADVIGEAFPHSRTDTRRALALTAVVRRFDPDQTILWQGQESSLALVLGGHVAIRRTTVDGRQLIVRIITRGALAGVLPFAARPTTADTVALTATPAALWRSEDVRSLAKADPGLAVDVLDNVLRGFEVVVERIDGLLHQNALRRVARVLDMHADLFFADPPVLSRRHLPILVGTSREMTGRVLRVLESEEIVARVGRDRLRLRDPVGLAAIAGSHAEPTDAPRDQGPAA